MYFQLSSEQTRILNELDKAIANIFKSYKGIEDLAMVDRFQQQKQNLYQQYEAEEFNKIERTPQTILEEATKHFDFVYTTTSKQFSSYKRVTPTTGLTEEEIEEEQQEEANFIPRTFRAELHLFFDFLEEWDTTEGTDYAKQLDTAINNYLLTKNKSQYIEVVEPKYLLVGVDKVNHVLTSIEPNETNKNYNLWRFEAENHKTTTIKTSKKLEPYQILMQDIIGTIYLLANQRETIEKPVKISLAQFYKLMTNARLNNTQRDKLIDSLFSLKNTYLDIKTPKTGSTDGTIQTREFGVNFVDIHFTEETYINGHTTTYLYIKSIPPLFSYNKEAKHLVSVDRAHFYLDYSDSQDNANYQLLFMELVRRARSKQATQQFYIKLDTLYKLFSKRTPQEKADPTSKGYQEKLKIYKKRDKKEFNNYLEQAKKNGVLVDYKPYTKGDLAPNTQNKAEYKDLRKNAWIGYQVTLSEEFYNTYHKKNKGE